MTTTVDPALLGGLAPHDGVRVLEASEAGVLMEATGADPQMLWKPSGTDAERLAGRAAVRVRVRLRAVEGSLVEPCVYADWGDGFSQQTWKPLSRSERGVYAATAHSDAGSLRALRFDPSTQPCRFLLSGFEVEPAGPAGASLPAISPSRRMVRRLLRRAPQSVQTAVRSARSLVTGDRRKRQAVGGRLLRGLTGGGSNFWRAAYVHQFEVARRLRSPDFAAPPAAPPRREVDGAAVVAFYLPQFYPIPENNAWWGEGFTEWTNVSKATPQFAGHYQPRLPGELGYYDLRVPEVRRRQAEMARRAGVDAFCFHFYWFGGRRVLEGPLDAFVADEAIDLPFALCWANENWTRRWDGQESEVLLAQRHSPEDDVAVFDEFARYMRSPRYLRSNGRPVLVLYRPDILPDAAATLERWRARARETGIGELFLLCTDAFGFGDYAAFGFNGLLEFPPHAISTGEIGDEVQLLNPHFSGKVYDYQAVVDAKLAELIEREDGRVLPGVMPSWDNEARKPGAGHAFHNATPDAFRRWTAAALDFTRQLSAPGERFVFVNAWNEWAEGTYLEPDRWFGHGFAQGLRAALEARAPRIGADHPLVAASAASARRLDAVVLLHLYYPELIEAFAAQLRGEQDRLDLDITFPDLWSEAELARLAAAFPAARLTPVPNAGRDLAPFVGALRRVDRAGYPVFCKLHSKRSPHLADGDVWRERLVTELVGPEATKAALARFASDPRLGLLAGAKSRMTLGEHGVLHNNRAAVEALSRRLGFRFGDDTPFAAGTMFWGRTAAFAKLAGLPEDALDFGVELGRIDGTLAHALERSTGAVVLASGHTLAFEL